MSVTVRAIVQGMIAAIVCGCTVPTIYHAGPHPSVPVRLGRALNFVLSWPSPGGVDAVRGAALIRDGPSVAQVDVAIARAILHTNPRLAQAAALLFAGATADAARARALPPELLGAMLLQESAYDPQAFSSAGAIGLAQFMPQTAADVGIDPYDPFASIAGAAALLGAYVWSYRDRYANPYAAALAAYNAGPLAVERYGGVPPYPETQQYVAFVFDRWAQIVSYESAAIRR